MARTKKVLMSVDENGNEEYAELRIKSPDAFDKTPLLKETESIEILGVRLQYSKPSLAQMPYFVQWVTKGFAPSVFAPEDLANLTSTQIFDEASKYIVTINETITDEQEKAKIMGAALLTSDASLQYLFPAIEQCFVGIKLSELKDEALNEIVSKFFNDLVEYIVANS